MSDKQQSMIARVLRASFWAFVIAIVVLIYKVPVVARDVGAADTLYIPLVASGIVVLGVMIYLHTRIIQGKWRIRQPGSDRSLRPNLVFCVVVQSALAESIAIYGLLIHMIGGSRSRSLTFCLLSLLGFVMLETWVPRYTELARQSEDTGQSR